MSAVQERSGAMRRPALFKVEQYARRPGVNGAQFFRTKGFAYFPNLPGVKSVRAY